jgi:hypothetical protein
MASPDRLRPDDPQAFPPRRYRLPTHRNRPLSHPTSLVIRVVAFFTPVSTSLQFVASPPDAVVLTIAGLKLAMSADCKFSNRDRPGRD